MKLIRISMLLAVFCLSAALNPREAQLYGSRVLICGPGVTVRHWTAYQTREKGRSGVESFVFDLMTKRSYPFGRCEIYKCGPEPDRMKDCRMN